VRSGIFEPREPIVVQMRENCDDRSPVPSCTRWPRTPRARIEKGQDELDQRVVNGVSLDQGSANIGLSRVGLSGH
jgi:hypothetical protein